MGPILVTGGAGFIGSHLVRRLVEQGEKVRVLEHPAAPVSHLPLDRIDLVRGDIRDRTAVEGAVRGCGEVYHLAANPKLWTQQPGDFCRGGRREYLDAELNLIDVRDVALGMVRAMERGRPGTRYLLGHENLAIPDVFGHLARLTGLPPPQRRVPYAVALVAASVSEF